MATKLVTMLMLGLLSAMLFADIGGAAPVAGTDDYMQFGGRQSVYANGDTIAFCYAMGYIMDPFYLGNIVYKYSENGGITFTTLLDREVGLLDGMPTLLKNGQEVIITYSALGKISRIISYDNGASFTQIDEVIGSDKLPITEKYDNEYHSCYTYQDFDNESWINSSLIHRSAGVFIANDRYPNNVPAYYSGDIDGWEGHYGKLRVNGDIRLRQGSYEHNQGWPRFGLTIISGEVIGPIDDWTIFPNGLIEHAPEIDFDEVSTHRQIASQAQIVGSNVPEPDKITIVTVNGTNFTTMIGSKVTTGFDTLWVYSDYPPGNGAPLFANIIPHVDTLWTQGPSGVTTGNTKFMVNSQLWIRGTFSGTQLWYSPYDIYLMDDILLTGTPMGQNPINYTDMSYNRTDMVAIVSGKSIYIQYGYKDPVTNERMHPNCGPRTGSIYVYASLYALGNGNGNSFEDGVFTFEYQHPHSSVPDVILSNPDSTLYDKIDLHRRTYPPTSTNPWPPYIDLPYYNPLWPEGNPFMERGTVKVYGSIAQRRRGFLRRERIEAEYPNHLGVWNTSIDFCGGASGTAYTDPVLGTTYQAINAPGAIGIGIGYQKYFIDDNRIKRDTFDFNPWNFGIKFESANQIGQWQNNAFRIANFDIVTKAYDHNYGKTVLGINSKLYKYSNDFIADISSYIPVKGYVTQLSLLNENQALVYVQDRHRGMHGLENIPDTLHVFTMDINNGEVVSLLNSDVPSEMNDIVIMDNGLKLMVKTNAHNEVQLYYLNQNQQLTPLYTWNPGLDALASPQYDFSKAKLHLIPAGNDSMYVFIWLPERYIDQYESVTNNGKLFMARGSIANTVNPDGNEVPMPVQKITMSNYPNPFVESTTIAVELAKDAQVSVCIYNIKGELIKSLAQADKKAGSFKLTWDGKDSNGKAVSSGVYLCKCSADKKEVMSKVLLLK